MGEFSSFELKSSKHSTNLYLYYFFLLLNTILMPITGITTIRSVLGRVGTSTGSMKLWNMMSDGITKQVTFFMRYLISCTFISSCFLILDVGH